MKYKRRNCGLRLMFHALDKVVSSAPKALATIDLIVFKMPQDSSLALLQETSTAAILNLSTLSKI